MFTPKLLSSHPFSIAELRIQNSASEWRPTPEYEELVRLEWQRIVENTRTRIWDGTSYRVLNPRALEEGAQEPIQLGTVAYRYIATFPSLHQKHTGSALEPLNHLSTIALIQTKDGFYIFGVRRQNGAVDLVGGGAQPDEIAVRSGADLEANLYKEIFEEVGVSRDAVEELGGIGTVFSSTSNMLIVGHVRLSLTAAEVQTDFEKRTDDEMSELVFIPKGNVRAYLANMPDYRNLLPQLLW